MFLDTSKATPVFRTVYWLGLAVDLLIDEHFICLDSDLAVYAFKQKPLVGENFWYTKNNGNHRLLGVLLDLGSRQLNFKDTLYRYDTTSQHGLHLPFCSDLTEEDSTW